MKFFKPGKVSATTDSATTDRLTLLALSVSLAVLVVVGALTLNMVQPWASSRSVTHTRDVLSTTDDLMAALLRVSNGHSGYLVTGQTKFLNDRETQIGLALKALKDLQALSINNDAQRARIEALQAKINERFENYRLTQAAFESGGLAAADSLFVKGRLIGVELRALIDAFSDEEARLLKELETSEQSMLRYILGGILLLLLFLAFLGLWIQKAIAARKAKENALLKSGALQDAVVANSKLSIIATDASGIIQIYNIGARQMLGYAPSEIIDQRSPSDLFLIDEIKLKATQVSTEFGAQVPATFEALVYKAQRKDDDILELTSIRKDSGLIDVSVTVTALRNQARVIIGYLFVATDNTARKQAALLKAQYDKEIDDLQLYTRSLFESTIDAIVSTDARGDIIDLNHPMELLSGKSRTEIIGKSFANFFSDRAQAQAAVDKVLAEGQIRDCELTVLGAEGQMTEVSCNAKLLYDQNRHQQGVIASIRDVTEYKRIEKSLAQNNIDLMIAKASAEKANLAKSDFLSSMSHELRTPLNAVLGFAQLLASETPPPTPTQQVSIDQILQAGWYLLRLINEILDLSMIESGKVEVSKESLSLNEVLKECHTMIGPQARARSIKLMFPSSGSPFYVLADRTRLKQVVFNLLSNAIKYSPPGSTVQVIYSAINSSNTNNSEGVRISVVDNGAGLSPELLSQLFQPFNRLGLQGTVSDGTGIGLVVTKRLVELMGGRIGVDSMVGSGSTFWFELLTVPMPQELGSLAGRNLIIDAKQSASAQSLQHVAEVPRWTLLYVEDNPANLVLVEQIIARRTDITLITAVHGHEGIEIAKRYLPDVILMDLNLPGISGAGALKVLQADPVTAHIPVIAISANALARDISNGLAMGFREYLTKPINVIEFLAALDKVLTKIGKA